jgi:multiple sugar transport system ATP-binding protein
MMNFIDATLTSEGGKYVVEFGTPATRSRAGATFKLELPDFKVNDEVPTYVGKEVILGIRPEDIYDDPAMIQNAQTGVVDCSVELTELMGAEVFLYLVTGDVNITARVSPRSTSRIGDDIKVVFDPSRIHLFDKETEQTIVN